MKRFLCLLIVFCMIPAQAFAAPSSWAEESIDKAYERGVVPESFDDDWQKPVTRREFSELAIRFMAHNLDYELEAFFDYAKSVDTRVGMSVGNRVDDYYFTAVKKDDKVYFVDCDDPFVVLAADMGIVEGMGDNTFMPEKSITREEAAVMLTRMRYLCTSTMGYSKEYFADHDTVADWAKMAVRHMKSSGVMTGVGDNKFDPKGTYSREMAVVTFVRQSELTVANGAYEMRPTYERIYNYYEDHPIYYIKSTFETDYGTLLIIGSGGAMHTGGEMLVFVTDEGEKYDFSEGVPYDTPWGQAHHETMELSEDKTKLIYTYSFDERAEYSVDINNPEVPVRVLHEKGKYVFTADLLTGEVTFLLTEEEKQ